MQQLAPNTTLQGGKYRIERVLGQGGFGNTYAGVNTVFDERVAIKEFFMQGINDRDDNTGSVSVSIASNRQQFEDQREKFKKEALRIRKLNNPHIIKVHDLFEENGTAYYVMDYVDGENLAERLKRTGKPMTEQEVESILPQILDALKTVHAAGIWHLDLKPANIMIDKSGNIQLIDFGASKQLNAQKGGATTSTAISYTNGYAPREQMEQNYDKFGPWTDIYALGATLYTLLSNKRPPLPTDIDDDISEDKHLVLPMPAEVTGSKLHKLILWMLSTNRNHRPQSVNDITNHLLLYDNDIEETIIESPKNSGQEVDNSDEETIIAALDLKETQKEEKLITNNKVVYKQEPSPKVESQTHEEQNSSTDNKDGNGTGILIGMGLIIGFIILLAVNSGKCSNSNSYSSQISEPMDSVAEIVDSVVVVGYVENYEYNSPLGKCIYKGGTHDGVPYDENGEVKFTDGRYYKGPIVNGNFTGDNVYFRYPNGDVFKGSFKNNAFYEGTYIIAKDGSSFTGTFKNGQPEKGLWYDKDGNVIE